MRVVEDSRSSRIKFWSKISFKKWLSRKHEKQGYYADRPDIDTSTTDSEQEDIGVWENEVERRYSCSATDFQLPRSFSTGFEATRHSSATLLPRDCEVLKSKLTDIQNFRVFVGTWNVGGRPPNDRLDIEEWLGSLKEPADIYVIGFQEVVPLSAGNVLGAENNGPAARWQHLIRHTLNLYTMSSCDMMSSGSFWRSCSTPSSLWQETSMDFIDNCINNQDLGAAVAAVAAATTNTSIGLNHLTSFASRGLTPVPSPASNGRSSSAYHKQARPRYAMIASKQMVGLFVSVWVKSDLRRSIRNVKVSCIGCGLMGYLGNKGSISVSLCLHQTTFCFVCSHLASGQRDGDEIRRNSDVAEILKRTQFRRADDANGAGLPETILEHDRVIWLGDLNYRLALSPSVTRSLLAREDWDALLEKDQLQIQRRAGRVFSGWYEGKIYFAPTYKYRANSDSYTLEKGSSKKLGEKKRTPAWCDRILWYGSGLRQLAYVRAETKFSDHRPVYAVFSAEVEVLSRKKLKDFLVFKSAKVQVEELLPRRPSCDERA